MRLYPPRVGIPGTDRQVRTISSAPTSTAVAEPVTTVEPSVTPPRPASRLAVVDGLRLLAAFSVLAYHYTGINRDYWGAKPLVEFPTLHHLSRYGYLGVELFFLISGFVILMTAYDRTVQSFVSSRVARRYPAYWVAILITFLLQQFWTGGRTPTFLEALGNLTMAQNAYGLTDVQGAFWTLWVELRFYLLIGVLMAVGMTRRRLLAFAVLWPLIGQIADNNGSSILSALLVPSYAPYFAAGIVLFLLTTDVRNLACWLALGFTGVFSVAQAAGYAERASQLTGARVSPVVTGGAVVVMLLVLLACTHGPLSRIRWGWLTFAGALTYPLYLVHGQIGYFVIDQLQDGLQSYVVLALATVASFVVAYLIHRLVERPAARPLRRAVESSLGRLR